MSHQIDFRSHKLTKKWNGHWGISGIVWKLMMGKRPFLINRQPYSTHVKYIEDAGFECVHLKTRKEVNGISRTKLAREWKHLTDDEMQTSGIFIQAIKQ